MLHSNTMSCPGVFDRHHGKTDPVLGLPSPYRPMRYNGINHSPLPVRYPEQYPSDNTKLDRPSNTAESNFRRLITQKYYDAGSYGRRDVFAYNPEDYWYPNSARPRPYSMPSKGPIMEPLDVYTPQHMHVPDDPSRVEQERARQWDYLRAKDFGPDRRATEHFNPSRASNLFRPSSPSMAISPSPIRILSRPNRSPGLNTRPDRICNNRSPRASSSDSIHVRLNQIAHELRLMSDDVFTTSVQIRDGGWEERGSGHTRPRGSGLRGGASSPILTAASPSGASPHAESNQPSSGMPIHALDELGVCDHCNARKERAMNKDEKTSGDNKVSPDGSTH